MSSAGTSRVVEALGLVLDRRERDRAPLRTQRVLGRNDDGTVRMQRVDAECVTRGEPSNAYEGQSIPVASGASAPFQRRGTAGVAPLAAAVVTASLWVERLDPNVYRPGGLYIVTVYGRGFDDRVRFEFLRPGTARQINTDIEITTSTFLDEGHFELEIEVAAEAAFYIEAPVAFGREAP